MVYCRAHSGGIKNGTPSAEVSEACNHIDGQAVTPSQAASGKRAMVRRHHIASPRSQRRCLLCLPGVRRAVPKHTRRCGTISRRRRTGPRSPPGRQRVLLRGSHVPAVPRYHCRKGRRGCSARWPTYQRPWEWAAWRSGHDCSNSTVHCYEKNEKRPIVGFCCYLVTSL